MRKVICNATIAGAILLSSFQLGNPDFKFSGNKATLGLANTNSKLILSQSITGFDGILKLRTATGENVKSVNAQTIAFTDGAVQVGNSMIDISGCTYNPQNAGADTITLSNGDVLSVSAGTTVEQNVAVAAGATAQILGTPNFSSTIFVGDNATLQLGIQHKLTQNISLGDNATLQLSNDLSLKDGIIFTGTGTTGGSGTVDLQKYSLAIGASGTTGIWSSFLTFWRAEDIQFNGPVSGGDWTFETNGNDKFSVLNGNGNILDLSNSNRIVVRGDHTLYISDLHIKGFGAFGQPTFNLEDSATTPGTIVLSNVTLELAGNYVHNSGSIKISGDNVRIIVGQPSGGAPYTFTVDQTTSALASIKDMFEVDGQILTYEPLGGDNTNPFFKIPTREVATPLVSADVGSNGGIIRSEISDAVLLADTIIDANANNGNTVMLTNNYDLFTNATSLGTPPTGRIVVTNPTGSPAQTVTIDGGTYAWQFPGGSTQVFAIAAGVTVTLQNVLLKDFSLDNVAFADATAVLQFGDSVAIELGEDLTLASGALSLVFVDNATVRGNGHTITLTADRSISQQTADKTLTLENLNLRTEHVTGLACSDSAAKILLQNSNLLINQAGYTFDTGSMDINGLCTVAARVTNAVAGTANFDLATSGTLTLKSGATLKIGRGINFNYNVNANNDSVPTAGMRYHLYFEDPSSTLYLDGCTISTTGLPITFTRGNLIVDNKVQLNADSVVGAGFETEIGTSMNVEILAGGVLNIDGNLKYVATSI
jgi:hypothetical protein